MKNPRPKVPISEIDTSIDCVSALASMPVSISPNVSLSQSTATIPLDSSHFSKANSIRMNHFSRLVAILKTNPVTTPTITPWKAATPISPTTPSHKSEVTDTTSEVSPTLKSFLMSGYRIPTKRAIDGSRNPLIEFHGCCLRSFRWPQRSNRIYLRKPLRDASHPVQVRFHT